MAVRIVTPKFDIHIKPERKVKYTRVKKKDSEKESFLSIGEDTNKNGFKEYIVTPSVRKDCKLSGKTVIMTRDNLPVGCIHEATGCRQAIIMRSIDGHTIYARLYWAAREAIDNVGDGISATCILDNEGRISVTNIFDGDNEEIYKLAHDTQSKE